MKINVSFAILAVVSLALGMSLPFPTATKGSYIVEGSSLESVKSAVLAVDGDITHELGIVNSVAATLTLMQRDELLLNPAILSVREDSALNTAGNPIPDA